VQHSAQSLLPWWPTSSCRSSARSQGGLDFSNYFIPLSKNVTATSYLDAKKQGAVLGYGQFLTVAINFMIIAFVLFVTIRMINKLKKEEEAKPVPAEVPADVKLLTEIRDLLARRPV
jgi:large conductance mechanosensitive channel